MSDEEEDILWSIFQREAPYEYVLRFEDKSPSTLFGFCSLTNKVIVLYRDKGSFDRKILTLLHEIAHARADRGHTLVWERELVHLLKKYEFDPNKIVDHAMGPALREYING